MNKKLREEYELWLSTEYRKISGGDEPAAAPAAEPAPVAEPAPASDPVEVPETTSLSEADMSAMAEMLGEKPASVVTEESAVEPVTPAPAKAAEPAPVVPAVEVPETELQASLRRESELRALINEMARGGVASVPGVAVAPPAPAVSSPTAAVAVPEPADPYAALIKILGPDAIKNFSEGMKKDLPLLTKEQLDTIVDKPELIVTALNDTRRKTSEEVLSILPTIVAGMVESYYATMRAADEFYSANSDLAPHRDYTRLVFQSVQAANKDKDMPTLLKLTAEETRKRLRLTAPVPAQPKPAKKPNFPAAKIGGGRVANQSSADGKVKTQSDYMAETLGS